MSRCAPLNPLSLKRLLRVALACWLGFTVLTALALAWPREGIAAGNAARLIALPSPLRQSGLPRSAAFRADGGVSVLYPDVLGRQVFVSDAARRLYVAVPLPDDCDPLYTAITPDREHLACWNGQGIRLSEETPGGAEQFLGRGLRRVRAITFAADGSRLAAIGTSVANGDSAAWVWTLAEGTARVLERGLPPLALSADGAYLAYSTGLRTLSTGENIRVWALAEPAVERAVVPLGDMSNRVAALAVSPRGDVLVVADGVGRIRLYDVATRLPLVTLTLPGGQRALSLAFSADGRALLALAGDGAVHFWVVGIF